MTDDGAHAWPFQCRLCCGLTFVFVSLVPLFSFPISLVSSLSSHSSSIDPRKTTNRPKNIQKTPKPPKTSSHLPVVSSFSFLCHAVLCLFRALSLICIAKNARSCTVRPRNIHCCVRSRVLRSSKPLVSIPILLLTSTRCNEHLGDQRPNSGARPPMDQKMSLLWHRVAHRRDRRLLLWTERRIFGCRPPPSPTPASPDQQSRPNLYHCPSFRDRAL